jgi:hypothetical protein
LSLSDEQFKALTASGKSAVGQTTATKY